MKLFAMSRGYSVTTTFNQYIQGQGSNPSKGFTFANYKAEIDAGRPVLIQVSGHTMLGFGYQTTGNIIYLHDTWDYNNHSMTWGGSYAGMQHYGVTVLQLAPINPPSTPKMHIKSIILTSASRRLGNSLSYAVTATVQVVDSSDKPLSGATVSGNWKGAYSTNVSGATNRQGNAVFTTPWIKGGGTFTFTATNLIKNGYVYDSSVGVNSKSITVP
jgi:hypothetical protein